MQHNDLSPKHSIGEIGQENFLSEVIKQISNEPSPKAKFSLIKQHKLDDLENLFNNHFNPTAENQFLIFVAVYFYSFLMDNPTSNDPIEQLDKFSKFISSHNNQTDLLPCLFTIKIHLLLLRSFYLLYKESAKNIAAALQLTIDELKSLANYNNIINKIDLATFSALKISNVNPTKQDLIMLFNIIFNNNSINEKEIYSFIDTFTDIFINIKAAGDEDFTRSKEIEIEVKDKQFEAIKAKMDEILLGNEFFNYQFITTKIQLDLLINKDIKIINNYINQEYLDLFATSTKKIDFLIFSCQIHLYHLQNQLQSYGILLPRGKEKTNLDTILEEKNNKQLIKKLADQIINSKNPSKIENLLRDFDIVTTFCELNLCSIPSKHSATDEIQSQCNFYNCIHKELKSRYLDKIKVEMQTILQNSNYPNATLTYLNLLSKYRKLEDEALINLDVKKLRDRFPLSLPNFKIYESLILIYIENSDELSDNELSEDDDKHNTDQENLDFIKSLFAELKELRENNEHNDVDSELSKSLKLLESKIDLYKMKYSLKNKDYKTFTSISSLYLRKVKYFVHDEDYLHLSELYSEAYQFHHALKIVGSIKDKNVLKRKDEIYTSIELAVSEFISKTRKIYSILQQPVKNNSKEKKDKEKYINHNLQTLTFFKDRYVALSADKEFIEYLKTTYDKNDPIHLDFYKTKITLHYVVDSDSLFKENGELKKAHDHFTKTDLEIPYLMFECQIYSQYIGKYIENHTNFKEDLVSDNMEKFINIFKVLESTSRQNLINYLQHIIDMYHINVDRISSLRLPDSDLSEFSTQKNHLAFYNDLYNRIFSMHKDIIKIKREIDQKKKSTNARYLKFRKLIESNVTSIPLSADSKKIDYKNMNSILYQSNEFKTNATLKKEINFLETNCKQKEEEIEKLRKFEDPLVILEVKDKLEFNQIINDYDVYVRTLKTLKDIMSKRLNEQRKLEEKKKKKAEEKRKLEEQAEKEAEEKRKLEEQAEKEAEEKRKLKEQEKKEAKEQRQLEAEAKRKKKQRKRQRKAEGKQRLEEQEKKEAEEKRKLKEQEKKEAEEKRKLKEQEKKEAEEKRKLKEQEKKEAEEKRKLEEQKKKEAEEQRKLEEQKKKEAEEKRKLEEQKKKEAEEKRKLEEQKKKEAEEQRKLEEQKKKEAEEKRKLEEQKKKEAEEQRKLEEQKKKEAEEQRKLEEQKKKEAEEQRKLEEQAKKETDEKEKHEAKRQKTSQQLMANSSLKKEHFDLLFTIHQELNISFPEVTLGIKGSVSWRAGVLCFFDEAIAQLIKVNDTDFFINTGNSFEKQKEDISKIKNLLLTKGFHIQVDSENFINLVLKENDQVVLDLTLHGRDYKSDNPVHALRAQLYFASLDQFLSSENSEEEYIRFENNYVLYFDLKNNEKNKTFRSECQNFDISIDLPNEKHKSYAYLVYKFLKKLKEIKERTNNQHISLIKLENIRATTTEALKTFYSTQLLINHINPLIYFEMHDFIKNNDFAEPEAKLFLQSFAYPFLTLTLHHYKLNAIPNEFKKEILNKLSEMMATRLQEIYFPIILRSFEKSHTSIIFNIVATHVVQEYAARKGFIDNYPSLTQEQIFEIDQQYQTLANFNQPPIPYSVYPYQDGNIDPTPIPYPVYPYQDGNIDPTPIPYPVYPYQDGNIGYPTSNQQDIYGVSQGYPFHPLEGGIDSQQEELATPYPQDPPKEELTRTQTHSTAIGTFGLLPKPSDETKPVVLSPNQDQGSDENSQSDKDSQVQNRGGKFSG